jgi:hypothetical protein
MGTNSVADWRQLTRQQKIILFVIVHINDLREAGMLAGGRINATEKTRAAVEQMQAEGFKPTPEEIRLTLDGLRRFHVPTGRRAVT